MSKLDDHLKHLVKILSDKKPGYVAEAEACLVDIAGMDDAGSINGLLELFDDAAPDELMFSIVHTIEKWDDPTYSKAILDSAEGLWKSSPRWAQILHIRIMNSQSTTDTYLAMLRSAPSSTRSTVRKIYEAVAKGWPKLTDKVAPILAQLTA